MSSSFLNLILLIWLKLLTKLPNLSFAFLGRCGNFMQLSLSTVVATCAALVSLNTLPNMFGLTGVWMSFGVFNIFRLAGVWLHQTKLGPLAKSKMAKNIA